MSEDKKEVVEAAKDDAKKQVCADRSSYVKGRTADGKVTMNNGDDIATALAGISLSNTYKIAAALLPFTEDELKNGRVSVAKTDDKPAVKAFKGYNHLNVGMQRMSLGNKIRGVINADNKNETPTLLAKLQKAVAPMHKEAEKAAAAAKEAEKEAA